MWEVDEHERSIEKNISLLNNCVHRATKTITPRLKKIIRAIGVLRRTAASD